MNQQDRTNTLTKVFETFGNYVFLKRLAAGGMAEVFLARPANHAGNGRIQVVKRLLPHVSDNAMFLKMFQTEIQVILGFNHPNVVQLHDFGEYNQRPFIAMEYIEGKNLKEVMGKFVAKKEKMPIPMALSLIAQAASGLSYAHTFVNKVTGEAVNAIHRDISPHNLILSYEGNLKVIDFGIAKAASGIMHEPTSAGTIKGKIAYLSPEQINGQTVDARSDVFSLGIVAWELLTLNRPFSRDGDSEITIIGKISNCDQYVVPPSIINPSIPAEIDAIILKALKKDPYQRYASASEFQIALRQAMMKFYPEYSYGDTSKMMTTLFSEEILRERKDLRDLNLHAQLALSTPTDAATVLIDKPGVISGVFHNSPVASNMDNVDARLMKIESMMKQKATGKHYMMLAFYVISIVMVKLDNQYNFFDFLFNKEEVSAPNLASANMVLSELSVTEPPRKPTSSSHKSRKPASADRKSKSKALSKTNPNGD